MKKIVKHEILEEKCEIVEVKMKLTFSPRGENSD